MHFISIKAGRREGRPPPVSATPAPIASQSSISLPYGVRAPALRLPPRGSWHDEVVTEGGLLINSFHRVAVPLPRRGRLKGDAQNKFTEAFFARMSIKTIVREGFAGLRSKPGRRRRDGRGNPSPTVVMPVCADNEIFAQTNNRSFFCLLFFSKKSMGQNQKGAETAPSCENIKF